MAQQMITLEEAAAKLGISPEEMKKRLKTDPDFKRLSQIRDGATVRFKLSAIEELGRELGLASEPELPLAPMEESEPPGSDDFKVAGAEGKKKAKTEEPKTDKVEKSKKGSKAEDAPLDFGSGTEEDVFSLADEPKPAPKSGKLTPSKPDSGKLTPAKPATKGTSDSSSGSDSDIRLDGGKPKKAKDESAIPTEEIALDFSGPGSAVIKDGSSAKLSAPKTGTGSSGKLSADSAKAGPGQPRPPVQDSSEFELSLDADSDDFELQMNADGSSEDEVELGTLPKEKTGTSSPRPGSKSGINLRDPSDSGISLEKGKDKDKDAKKDDDKKKKKDDGDVDFELSLDSSQIPSSTKLGAPKSGKLVLDTDSSSEFELTLDDSGDSSVEKAALGEAEESADKGDIFETDFEIPPMPDESGSDAVALESDTDLEKSDFELAMDESDVAADDQESASEVVLLEDDAEADAEAPAPKTRAKVKTKKLAPTEEADVDLAEEPEDDASASKALKGVKGKKRDEEEEEEEAPAGVVVERPTKPWGILPIIPLAITFPLILLGGLMAYEMLSTMWGYQQPRKPAAPLIRGIASQFDMELRDQ
jgi:hypothetical protein